MNRVIFSSWEGKVVDNRGLDNEKYAKVENLTLPLEYDDRQMKAFISWNGIVLADDGINIIDAVYSYLKEVQKLSCGECTIGYAGIRVMLDIMGRILNGNGAESDIDLLQWLAVNIKKNGKCSFCSTSVTPILDTIDYFKEDYLKLIAGKKTTSKTTYMTRVTAPCMEACPAHQDIPGYIELIRNQRYEEALEVIRRTNCLPGITGRACVAFCEASCVRGGVDSPVAIRALKRVPADDELSSGSETELKKAKDSGTKVAVIGAGPAGLACSYN